MAFDIFATSVLRQCVCNEASYYDTGIELKADWGPVYDAMGETGR